VRRLNSLTSLTIAMALAGLTLSACGSSSPSHSMQTTGSADATTATGTASTSTGAATGTNGGSTDSKTTPTAATGTVKPGALKQALAGYEACMREHGVQVPRRTRGSTQTSAEVKARTQALSACRPVLRTALHTLAHSERHTTPASPTQAGSTGSTNAAGSPTTTTPAPSAPAHIKPAATPAPVTAALKHFTACMREHGITNFPEPEGASFNVSHVSLDRSSAQFKAAEKACNPILQAIG
jgi:hypothetical protein